MRRTSLSAIAALLATLAFTIPVSAAKPDRSPVDPGPPLEFPAGDVCDFGVVLSTPLDNGTVRTWDLGGGAIRILQSGYAELRATNPASGESFDHPGGYRLQVNIRADGSVDAVVSGTFFAYYFAGDPVVGLSQGLYAVHGRVMEHYSPDGTLLAARLYGGHVVDLCGLLAED